MLTSEQKKLGVAVANWIDAVQRLINGTITPEDERKVFTEMTTARADALIELGTAKKS